MCNNDIFLKTYLIIAGVNISISFLIIIMEEFWNFTQFSEKFWLLITVARRFFFKKWKTCEQMPKNMGKFLKIWQHLCILKFKISERFWKFLGTSWKSFSFLWKYMPLNFCRKLLCQQIQENEILPLYWHSLLCKLKEIIKEFLLQSWKTIKIL